MPTAVKKSDVTEDEFNAQVEAELAQQVEAELAKQMAQKRADIAHRLRVEANMAHLNKVNARHPVQDAPAPEAVAARHRLADEGLRRDAERRAANQSRWEREWLGRKR
jgi:hypothetical protein